MKKNILIVSDSFKIGGIQTSLQNFLNTISKENLDITLFLFNDEGLKDINLNSNIKIKTGNKLLKIVSCTSDYAKKQGIFIYSVRKIFALFCKIFSSRLMYSLVFMFEKKLKGYDTVISYSNNISNKSVYFGYNLFSIKRVEAINKIAYVHVDYNTIHSKYIDSEYKFFNKIWFVSEYSKNTFLKYNPEMDLKCEVIYNFIDIDKLKDIKKNPYKDNKFHIVTVGRLDDNKSQIEAIEICKKLKSDKLEFNWFLLGDGPNKDKIKMIITENNLTETLYLCGNITNVNEYLYYANLFVSFSKNESYGLAVAESLILNCITISRNIPVMDELILNGKNGIICDINDMYFYINKMIKDNNYYKKMKNNSKFNQEQKQNLIKVLETLNGGINEKNSNRKPNIPKK